MMYIHHMGKLVRKQVYLTAEQDQWLARAAVQERRPAAEIIRAALDARMRLQRAPRARPATDSLWKIVGLGASDQRDVSEQVDHYLYGTRKR
jgi:hypothetical protein